MHVFSNKMLYHPVRLTKLNVMEKTDSPLKDSRTARMFWSLVKSDVFAGTMVRSVRVGTRPFLYRRYSSHQAVRGSLSALIVMSA